MWLHSMDDRRSEVTVEYGSDVDEVEKDANEEEAAY